MNKFLLILLIAIVASTEVQHLDLPPKPPGPLLGWFKSQGLYEHLCDIGRRYGKPKALAYCKSKAPTNMRGLCQELVDFLLW